MKDVRDVKSIPGEECMSQHRLLVCDIVWREKKTMKVKKTGQKVRAWRLKEQAIKDKFAKEVVEGLQETNDATEDWETLTEKMTQVARNICGVAKRTGKRDVVVGRGGGESGMGKAPSILGVAEGWRWANFLQI